jgi:hypothetical protein
MHDRFWAILSGMLALLRMCPGALRGMLVIQSDARQVPCWGSLWLGAEFDASRMDAFCRSSFWGGAGLPQAPTSARPVAATLPLTSVVAMCTAGDPPESYWWLGA